MSHEYKAPNPAICPTCKAVKIDCFAYKDGKCRALNNTYFKHDRCPFYKHRDNVEYKWRK